MSDLSLKKWSGGKAFPYAKRSNAVIRDGDYGRQSHKKPIVLKKVKPPMMPWMCWAWLQLQEGPSIKRRKHFEHGGEKRKAQEI